MLSLQEKIHRTIQDVEVKPLIHRVRLFHRDMGFLDLKKALGIHHSHKMKGPEKSKMGNFKSACYFKLDDIQCSAYHNPINSEIPSLMVYIADGTQENLARFLRIDDGFKMSSAEYAIDFMCDSPKQVRRLFCLMRRYMYFPSMGRTKIVGELGCGNMIPSKQKKNSVYYVMKSNNEKKIGGLKLYERGDDDKKDGEGWKFRNLNRVRFEYTVDVPSKVFTKYNMEFLSEFIKNCNFSAVVNKKVQFKIFKRRYDLPQETDSYDALCLSGVTESFQEMFVSSKKRNDVSNMSQCIEDSTYMKRLRDKIKTAMAQFNRKWKNKLEPVARRPAREAARKTTKKAANEAARVRRKKMAKR